jgi:hypothetical protein
MENTTGQRPTAPSRRFVLIYPPLLITSIELMMSVGYVSKHSGPHPRPTYDIGLYNSDVIGACTYKDTQVLIA